MDAHCKGGRPANSCGKADKKIRVVNIGLQNFYEALISQNVKAAQITWRPPVKQSEEITNLLSQLL
jgi:hypothetical protein